jgi:hypothetical protein
MTLGKHMRKDELTFPATLEKYDKRLPSRDEGGDVARRTLEDGSESPDETGEDNNPLAADGIGELGDDERSRERASWHRSSDAT